MEKDELYSNNFGSHILSQTNKGKYHSLAWYMVCKVKSKICFLFLHQCSSKQVSSFFSTVDAYSSTVVLVCPFQMMNISPTTLEEVHSAFLEYEQEQLQYIERLKTGRPLQLSSPSKHCLQYCQGGRQPPSLLLKCMQSKVQQNSSLKVTLEQAITHLL